MITGAMEKKIDFIFNVVEITQSSKSFTFRNFVVSPGFDPGLN